MAAKAARPATAIELPTVLAAPLKGVMGELVAPGAVTLDLFMLERGGVWKFGGNGDDLRSG